MTRAEEAALGACDTVLDAIRAAARPVKTGETPQELQDRITALYGHLEELQDAADDWQEIHNGGDEE